MKIISTKHIQIYQMKCNTNLLEAELVEDEEIKIHINDYLFVSFICIRNNLESLAIGYLIHIGLNLEQIKLINIKENDIFINCNISKEDFLNLVNKTDPIPTCQSIYLHKNNNLKNIIPFNGTKVNLDSIQLSSILKSLDLEIGLFKAYLIHEEKIYFANDVNAKNAIYKVFGEFFTKQNCQNCLIESTLVINFPLSIEILKQVLMYKITFIVFISPPSFTTVKYAQKYGLTIIEMKSCKEFKIYTHHSRIKN